MSAKWSHFSLYVLSLVISVAVDRFLPGTKEIFCSLPAVGTWQNQSPIPIAPSPVVNQQTDE